MKNNPYIYQEGNIDESICRLVLTDPPSLFPGVYVHVNLDFSISLIGKSYIEEQYELEN